MAAAPSPPRSAAVCVFPSLVGAYTDFAREGMAHGMAYGMALYTASLGRRELLSPSWRIPLLRLLYLLCLSRVLTSQLTCFSLFFALSLSLSLSPSLIFFTLFLPLYINTLI